jgi:hypothetical protein
VKTSSSRPNRIRKPNPPSPAFASGFACTWNEARGLLEGEVGGGVAGGEAVLLGLGIPLRAHRDLLHRRVAEPPEAVTSVGLRLGGASSRGAGVEPEGADLRSDDRLPRAVEDASLDALAGRRAHRAEVDRLARAQLDRFLLDLVSVLGDDRHVERADVEPLHPEATFAERFDLLVGDFLAEHRRPAPARAGAIGRSRRREGDGHLGNGVPVRVEHLERERGGGVELELDVGALAAPIHRNGLRRRVGEPLLARDELEPLPGGDPREVEGPGGVGAHRARAVTRDAREDPAVDRLGGDGHPFDRLAVGADDASGDAAAGAEEQRRLGFGLAFPGLAGREVGERRTGVFRGPRLDACLAGGEIREGEPAVLARRRPRVGVLSEGRGVAFDGEDGRAGDGLAGGHVEQPSRARHARLEVHAQARAGGDVVGLEGGERGGLDTDAELRAGQPGDREGAVLLRLGDGGGGELAAAAEPRRALFALREHAHGRPGDRLRVGSRDPAGDRRGLGLRLGGRLGRGLRRLRGDEQTGDEERGDGETESVHGRFPLRQVPDGSLYVRTPGPVDEWGQT